VSLGDLGSHAAGEAVVHDGMSQLVDEDVSPSVASLVVGSEQVLLSAGGLQPPHPSSP